MTAKTFIRTWLSLYRCVSVGILFLPATVHAQAQDSARAQPLHPISVTVTRSGSRTPLELPFALSRQLPDSTRPGLRRTSIGDLLVATPGIQVQDRANPSQDPRLSIRGFGSRSAFGVRGVRVLRDGLPLSLPDGQTPLDWLDLESIGEVEVIRGTAAALFGNAAGGVVSFRSREPTAAPLALTSRIWNGAGLTRWSLAGSSAARRDFGALSGASLAGSFTSTSGDGYRQWSEQKATSLFVRSLATIAGTRIELQGTRYDSPLAQNTGAITAAELARDARLPDSLNISKHSRKAAAQSQVGLLASRGSGDREIAATLYTGTRSLDNPLPFSIVGVARRYSGASLRAGTRVPMSSGIRAVRLNAGMDAQWQRDDRLNWENCSDVLATAPRTVKCPTTSERGAVRLDQKEDVAGIGSYARAEFELPSQVFVSGALRFDQVHFSVDDRFITASNADDSGERTMNATSPLAGIVWRFAPLASVYANWSSAFETPTITELTNQPDGSAGLNAVIAPQRTRTGEVGVQGMIGSRVDADVALFNANVDDELISFDVPNAPGRRAFRNAGRTSRKGMESSARLHIAGNLIGAAYTWSRFRFVDYVVGTTSFAGKVIPGIPEHQLQAYWTTQWQGLFTTVESRMSSSVTANDAGTVSAAGYAIWALRGGYDIAASSRRAGAQLVFGVENIFDRRYAASIVTNATRDRYFEPGIGRNVYVGFKLDLAIR